MSINKVSQHIQQYLPSSEQIIGKFSKAIPRIAHTLNKVAIPAFVLFLLSNVPGADAGPVAYGVCCACCISLATPILIPACITGCIPLGVAPTP